MRAAIIGANSYIARNVIYCIKRDYQQIELLLYDIGDKQVDGNEHYESISILDREDVKRINMDSDLIFIFAGKTGSANGFDEFDTFIDVNEKGLLNVLNEYRSQHSKARVIFPSTRLVYKGKKGKLAENAEKEFKTVYAINKFACEKYLEQYHNVFGVEYCIFRICIPYGTLIPGASSYGTVELMLSKARNGENIVLYGDGEVRRTLTYIGDLCRILIEGSMRNICCNDVYNVGGEDYSLFEMALLIANQYKTEIDFVEYPEMAMKIESGDTVFDSDKLDNILKIPYRQRFAKWCESLIRN